MAILGIDEVGRGPLAGPLVVGAVILPDKKPDWVNELKDSKKLTIKKRELLNGIILNEAPATGLGWVSALELDEIGISEALKLATKRAVKKVQQCSAPFSQIIIDGKVNFLAETRIGEFVSTMPKADNLVKEVSAASIIAKVARDHYMTRLAEEYPKYGFESHVGYGTARHLAAIKEYGICPEHRKSFEPIKSMVGFTRETINKKNTTGIGNRAEQVVSDYLEKSGHKIIDRNYKSKFCEIDIVSVLGDNIYFTEVKYRKSNLYGGGLAAIDARKRHQMEFAAKYFLTNNNKYNNLQPLMAVANVGGDYVLEDWFVLDFN
ncbi:ribonuclease HII [Candidatus Saccharibacteria bacterium]|nr:ribonuclease HII [Candidatus Saccharibacteria bacterium]